MHINAGGFNTLQINEWVLCGWGFCFLFSFFWGGGIYFSKWKKKKQPNKHSRRAVDWFERGQPIKRLESAKTGCIFIT